MLDRIGTVQVVLTLKENDSKHVDETESCVGYGGFVISFPIAIFARIALARASHIIGQIERRSVSIKASHAAVMNDKELDEFSADSTRPTSLIPYEHGNKRGQIGNRVHLSEGLNQSTVEIYAST